MVASNYKYDLVKSIEYYCLAALFETIFKTQEIKIDQKEIGKKFDIVLPNSQMNIDEKELGISIDILKFNNYFQYSSFPFHATYISANTIFDGELDAYIKNVLRLNSHVIVAYNYDQLYKNIRSLVGHVSLVKGIQKDKILLLDPGPKTFGEYTFSFDELFAAMKYRNGGILTLDVTA